MGEAIALTTEQVARALGVSVETVHNLTQQKRLAGVKIGNKYRFHPDAVNRFLLGEPATKEQPPDPEPLKRRGTPDWLKNVPRRIKSRSTPVA